MSNGPSFEDRFKNVPTKGRPDHPDFWVLAENVSARDRRMDIDPTVFEGEISRWVDGESLAYLSLQRVFRVLGVTTSLEMMTRRKEVARLAALYHEAFIMGAEFQASGGHREVS